ncbi:MAG: hypothetical protein ACO1QR_11175 [Chthoniobacteraceae bacterium]
MSSTACPEDASATIRQHAGTAASATAEHAGLPFGTWIRLIHQLPVEARPTDENLIPARKLVIGSPVFIDLAEGALRVRGWGIVKRLREPLGWHVAFADGSAVGMQRSELKKHCWVADATSSAGRRIFKGKWRRSPQRNHGSAPQGK